VEKLYTKSTNIANNFTTCEAPTDAAWMKAIILGVLPDEKSTIYQVET
jgi:hypothetical protein